MVVSAFRGERLSSALSSLRQPQCGAMTTLLLTPENEPPIWLAEYVPIQTDNRGSPLIYC